MNNSIHQFAEEGVKRLTKVFETYTEDLTKIAEMVQGVTDEIVKLGTSIIAEEWESYDELLRKRSFLRPGLADLSRFNLSVARGFLAMFILMYILIIEAMEHEIDIFKIYNF